MKSVHSVNSALYLHHCGEEYCAPRHTFGPAVRDHWLFHYIFNGSGTFYRKEESYHLTAGQCFLISPGEVCTYAADAETPWHYGWVGLNGGDAPRTLALCGLSRETPVAAPSSPEIMLPHLRDLIESCRLAGNDLAVMARLYRLLEEMSYGMPPQRREGKTFDLLEEYLGRNYSYHLSVAQLAEQLHLDRSQLFRVVKRETGLSPQQYLTRYRLRESLRLLRETELPITEVVYSVGFEDLSHFSRCFKREYGISPRQYRREHAGEARVPPSDFNEPGV